MTIFETLVDGLHDLDDFKSFLNQRIEERTSFNKQKMDLYAEIKSFEAQKLDLHKEHQETNVFANSEALLAQIEELKKKLESASRVDSKRIQQQITDLTNEKNKVIREMQKVEEQIERR